MKRFSFLLAFTLLGGICFAGTLQIDSSPSGAAISVLVSPEFASGGPAAFTAPFDYSRPDLWVVTLTAPAEHNGLPFEKWVTDTIATANGRDLTVTIFQTGYCTALYKKPKGPQITVEAVTTEGESIPDLAIIGHDGCNCDGFTPYSFEETDGRLVLYLPPTGPELVFVKWLVNGQDHGDSLSINDVETDLAVVLVYQKIVADGQNGNDDSVDDVADQDSNAQTGNDSGSQGGALQDSAYVQPAVGCGNVGVFSLFMMVAAASLAGMAGYRRLPYVKS